MAKKFRKGQKVRCNHYKIKYICTVNDVFNHSSKTKIEEVWVTDSTGMLWWGPARWFEPLENKRTK